MLRSSRRAKRTDVSVHRSVCSAFLPTCIADDGHVVGGEAFHRVFPVCIVNLPEVSIMPVTAPEVIAVDPRRDPRWHALAAGPHGSLFTSPQWIEAVCATYGFTPKARVVVDGFDEPVGGFAWVPISDVRGPRICSLPFSDWADPIAPDEPTWRALVDGLLTSDARLALRCLSATTPMGDPRLRITGEVAWHSTRLDAPIPELRRRISHTARRNIAKAERTGVRIETSTELEGMRRFHRMQVSLRKYKYRLLAQPVDFFEHIWDQFSSDDSVLTVLACVDDVPIAGVVFLVWNNVLHCKFAASVPDHLNLRPNDAIYWAGIRWGFEHGMHSVDWGITDLDQPGLLRYKRKYATDERRVVSLHSAAGPSPGEAEAGRVLDEVTELLTDDSVPDEITRRAGALLYRYFC